MEVIRRVLIWSKSKKDDLGRTETGVGTWRASVFFSGACFEWGVGRDAGHADGDWKGGIDGVVGGEGFGMGRVGGNL